MSLYYEAASFVSTPIANEPFATIPSSTQIYAKASDQKSRPLKCKPAHLVALLGQAAKWSEVLSAVVEAADVLKVEKKLTPVLALLLAHDLLLSKGGVAAPKDHVLRQAISRHRARLSAEFTKARIMAGFATTDAWRGSIEANADISDDSSTSRHPRWIRLNTLKSSFDDALNQAFAGYKSVTGLSDILNDSTGERLMIDPHIPNLIAVPQAVNLTKSQSYLNGALILQDKASCFPAYLLDPASTSGDIIDTCAAPGNKTTHLAALLAEGGSTGRQVYACERDSTRSELLQKMVAKAGANNIVTCLPRQDFLRLDPQDQRFGNVTALLLDPSCSGSGMLGRDDEDDSKENVVGRKIRIPNVQEVVPRASNKRKRGKSVSLPASASAATAQSLNETIAANTQTETADSTAYTERLQSLSRFQTQLLTHAMRFPRAERIVYSTCSIHYLENENVAIRALQSDVAMKRGWRVLRREEQVAGLQKWPRRGEIPVVSESIMQEQTEVENDAKSISESSPRQDPVLTEACLRCKKGTEEGTMGFFAIGFVRTGDDCVQSKEDHTWNISDSDEEDEWGGLDDSE